MIVPRSPTAHGTVTVDRATTLSQVMTVARTAKVDSRRVALKTITATRTTNLEKLISGRGMSRELSRKGCAGWESLKIIVEGNTVIQTMNTQTRSAGSSQYRNVVTVMALTLGYPFSMTRLPTHLDNLLTFHAHFKCVSNMKSDTKSWLK